MSPKEFTSFDVAAVVRELKASITDSVVNNIYQIGPKKLLFKLHRTQNSTPHLVVEAGRRINLTRFASDKPPRPPPFCMALRKYLRNARLLQIEQHKFERVIIFSFKTREGKLRLVAELFGEGNMILAAEDGKILQALTYKRMRDRDVVRGEPFKFAPSSSENPLELDYARFTAGLRSSGGSEVVRVLPRFVGIGGTYSEEVLLRADVEKNKTCQQLSDDDISSVFSKLQGILSQVVEGKLDPCIVMDDAENYVDVVPINLVCYEGTGFKTHILHTFNEAVDEFYSRLSAIEEADQTAVISELQRQETRLEHIITEQRKTIAATSAEAEECKRIGDIIYARFNDLQRLVYAFINGRTAGKTASEVVDQVSSLKKQGLEPWMLFESQSSNRNMLKVRVEDLAFELDLHLTLLDNAARFYERGKHARRRMEGAQAAMQDTLKKLEKANARIDQAKDLQLIKPAEAIEQLEKRKIRKKEWFEKFRWFTSSDGFLVVAGKDAVTNEVLVKKHTEPTDIVFHADITGAPFVVVKTEGKEPGENCILESGEFAAAYSRAWREGFASVDVYWVKPDQLSKAGASGESVSRGAFVVRGERNWQRGVELKLAIGVAVDPENGIQFVGGPVESVRSKSSVYIRLVPGDHQGKQLFSYILRTLSEKMPKNVRENLLASPIEKIREYIPFSKGLVVEES